MGLLDILLGRKKPAQGPKLDGVLSIATAQVTLADRFQMTPTGKGGVCFRPVSSSFFTDLERELQGILAVGERAAKTRWRVVDDGYGFRWVVVQDREFEDLVTAAYEVAQAFAEHGYLQQLLAAVFPFRHQAQEVHWVFSFRRGAFYPFIPIPERQQRDNALELSLASKVEGELPMEKALERWYPLWGAPFNAIQGN